MRKAQMILDQAARGSRYISTRLGSCAARGQMDTFKDMTLTKRRQAKEKINEKMRVHNHSQRPGSAMKMAIIGAEMLGRRNLDWMQDKSIRSTPWTPSAVGRLNLDIRAYLLDERGLIAPYQIIPRHRPRVKQCQCCDEKLRLAPPHDGQREDERRPEVKARRK